MRGKTADTRKTVNEHTIEGKRHRDKVKDLQEQIKAKSVEISQLAEQTVVDTTWSRRKQSQHFFAIAQRCKELARSHPKTTAFSSLGGLALMLWAVMVLPGKPSAPMTAEDYRAKGAALARQAKFSDAIRVAELGLEQFPNDGLLVIQKASYMEAKGKFMETLRFLEHHEQLLRTDENCEFIASEIWERCELRRLQFEGIPRWLLY